MDPLLVISTFSECIIRTDIFSNYQNPHIISPTCGVTAIRVESSEVPVGNVVNQKLYHILFGISDIAISLRLKRGRDVVPCHAPIQITRIAAPKEKEKKERLL